MNFQEMSPKDRAATYARAKIAIVQALGQNGGQLSTTDLAEAVTNFGGFHGVRTLTRRQVARLAKELVGTKVVMPDCYAVTVGADSFGLGSMYSGTVYWIAPFEEARS